MTSYRVKFLRQRRRADALELELIELGARVEAAEAALDRILQSRTSMTVIGVDVSSRGSIAFAGGGAGSGGFVTASNNPVPHLRTDDERRAR